MLIYLKIKYFNVTRELNSNSIKIFLLNLDSFLFVII